MTTTQAQIRTARARRAMERCAFVPEAPVRVEPFEGYQIRQHAERSKVQLTDFHIVDARGRTIHVLRDSRQDKGITDRGRRAAWYAAEMNALLA